LAIKFLPKHLRNKSFSIVTGLLVHSGLSLGIPVIELGFAIQGAGIKYYGYRN